MKIVSAPTMYEKQDIPKLYQSKIPNLYKPIMLSLNTSHQ